MVWIYCFLAYMANRTPDQATQRHLTYARVLLHEAMCHGGSGWLEYDKIFPQQAAIDPVCQWHELDARLFTTTVLGAKSGPGFFCTL